MAGRGAALGFWAEVEGVVLSERIPPGKSNLQVRAGCRGLAEG